MKGQKPDFPPDFPVNLRQLIDRGWRHDQNERATIREFITVFRQMEERSVRVTERERERERERES